jgi:hypothetical protein
MILLYLIALIPSLIGLFLYIFNKRVVWLEWIGSTVISLLFAAAIHILIIFHMTSDVEIWSGKINKAVFYPEWVERYTDTHTYTTGTGKNKRTHTRTETHYRTHHEKWVAETTLNSEKDIDELFYKNVVSNFGGKIKAEYASKSGFHSGDHNIYTTGDDNGYMYPITEMRRWENRVKAAPSVFSFIKVPTNISVYEYPESVNWLVSNRILGNVPIGIGEWDKMNTRLNPHKKVNVIIVNFGQKDKSIAIYQQAKWVNGKKNDLVICYGEGDRGHANWSFVFGWTEKEEVKRNLETILLNNLINNSIIGIIESEIKANYLIKDWHKFDYITIEPPFWSYVTLLILLLISQSIFWYWATINDFDKT